MAMYKTLRRETLTTESALSVNYKSALAVESCELQHRNRLNNLARSYDPVAMPANPYVD